VCEGLPSFGDFACGVLASPDAPWFITEDQELPKRYDGFIGLRVAMQAQSSPASLAKTQT
jgi:hypothetical protein